MSVTEHRRAAAFIGGFKQLRLFHALLPTGRTPVPRRRGELLPG